MAEACGTQQVRLNRQFDTRLRRMSEQVQQGIQRLEDATATGTNLDASCIRANDLSATATYTEFIAAPTQCGQRLMRCLDTWTPTMPKKYRMEFTETSGAVDTMGSAVIPVTTPRTTLMATGDMVLFVGGKYKSHRSWYRVT